MYDIVYLLKNDIKPDELRYSLRSVCEYFDFSRVIFHGGCPDGIKPDLWINYKQKGSTRRERGQDAMLAIMQDERISEDFWLFNDDFFVWQKAEPKTICRGTLDEYIPYIERGRGPSEYTQHLRETIRDLRDLGLGIKNYETHTPLLVNRNKGLITLKKLPRAHFRSSYGNLWDIGGVYADDCKITNNKKIPADNWDYVSTHDLTFRKGAVGRCIREKFTKPCKYEL